MMVHDLENAVDPKATATVSPSRSRTVHITIVVAALRIIQVAAGFATLFLTGTGASIFQGDFFHTFESSFLSFVWTLLFFITVFVRSRWFPKSNFIWGHRIFEITVLIAWLITFSLLVWECMDGDEAFAVLSESGDQQLMSFVSASDTGIAIRSLKFATALSCVSWIGFAATFVIGWKQGVA